MGKQSPQSKNNLKRSEEFSLKSLPLEGSFPFACYPGISCYNHCCYDTDILLTPIDILKLKQALGISSVEFLQEHIHYLKLPGTEIPLVKLKMQDSKDSPCIFLEPAGCSIYENRPTVCRSYPIGFGLADKRSLEEHEKNFLIIESLCHGHREKKQWKLEEWKQNQGVEHFETFNQLWIEFVVRLKSSLGKTLDEQQRSCFLMASYDHDTFREFVTRSSFHSRFGVPEKRIREIEASDEALLQLALDWLQFQFFQEGPLTAKS